jgi:hypothetical protein
VGRLAGWFEKREGREGVLGEFMEVIEDGEGGFEG